ncbi:hypothetical protein TNCV_2290261 [Trichonephila clavipes]|uniref:Uncharacterized protein n=1 Tax=Trichonephila clavipes TaxID=2585209 RepID=A0A8X6V5X2_TRICX|nr:hypothetical protein TNCV_2290261 [Trichonephila clavipes]
MIHRSSLVVLLDQLSRTFRIDGTVLCKAFQARGVIVGQFRILGLHRSSWGYKTSPPSLPTVLPREKTSSLFFVARLQVRSHFH